MVTITSPRGKQDPLNLQPHGHISPLGSLNPVQKGLTTIEDAGRFTSYLIAVIKQSFRPPFRLSLFLQQEIVQADLLGLSGSSAQQAIYLKDIKNLKLPIPSISEQRKATGMKPMTTKDLLKMMRDKMELLNIKNGYLSRNMNEGFSGGEKKRNEIFQMAMLEPKLSILDETDSGLDIDALRIVANGVNKLKNKNNATIVITHYQRLLDYIVPDFVHVLHNGRIIKSGGKELALELEEKGYDWITKEADKKWD